MVESRAELPDLHKEFDVIPGVFVRNKKAVLLERPLKFTVLMFLY